MNPNQGNKFPPNGTPQTPPPQPNVGVHLQAAKGGPGPHVGPGPVPQRPLQQNLIRAGTQQTQAPQRIMPIQGGPFVVPGPAQAQAQGAKPGAKRTVMQRTKSAGGDGFQTPEKVRLVKLTGAGGDGASEFLLQEPRLIPQMSPGPLRKVTTTGAPAQLQANRGSNPLHNRVVLQSRGRGAGGPAGRGRPVASRQSQQSDPQPCMVSIEGLSSSTTDLQLKNLLNSIGPIQMFKMLPQQRKAIARFSSPQHAHSFQVSFHRHMIDLSHIDVTLIDG